MMLRLFTLMLCIFISLPLAAHVRWFVDEPHHIKQASFSFDLTSQLILTGAMAFLAGCYYLHRQTIYQPMRRLLHQPWSIPNKTHWLFAALLVALTLISNVWQGIVFAPNLKPDSLTTNILLIMQAICYFILTINPFWAGILLVSALTILLFNQPWWLVIDYIFEFGAIALAMIFVGKAFKANNTQQLTKYTALAISVLRIGLGIQLMVLAVHNKLLNPGLGLAFLQHHSIFNFMPQLGFEQFSDLHFVLSAGIAELCFGLLITFNIATRFVVIIVTGCFAITGIIIGGEELIGHLPIFAINLLLIIYGSNGEVPVITKSVTHLASKPTNLSLQ